MKNLLSVLAFVFAGSVSLAASTTVPFKVGDLGMYTVEGERLQLLGVATQIPKCPPNRMCEPTTLAMINLTLSGCVDRLAGASAHVQNTTIAGRPVKLVTVTGIAIANEASRRTRCLVAPTAQIAVHLGMGILTKENVVLTSGNFVLPVTKN